MALIVFILLFLIIHFVICVNYEYYICRFYSIKGQLVSQRAVNLLLYYYYDSESHLCIVFVKPEWLILIFIHDILALLYDFCLLLVLLFRQDKTIVSN